MNSARVKSGAIKRIETESEVSEMLRPNRYQFYTTKEISAGGWLRRQLEIEMNGLVGNLHKVWPDVRDSRWIGGDREGWERVPYWLDGFIPLAYLLDDKQKIADAKRYIDGILAGQKEDGWLCPCGDGERARYDMWALFLICKVLVVYHDCSGDERIEDAVYRALYSLLNHIRSNTIFNWASARWFECLIPIYWLYERRHEDWLLYLAHALCVQGMSYKELFANWKDQLPKPYWSYQTHGVNLAMALKSELLASRVRGSDAAISEAEDITEQMYDKLMTFHGTAVGHFTSDENLMGTSPIQGAELCGVVEAMYSYEQNFAITGNPVWLDRLETLAFNALPAALSPDMWAHQYDQMVNQIACVRFGGKPIFGTNGADAHLFGLEPNYGCCTANMGQGFPKFALTAYMKGERSVLVASPVPATLNTEIENVPVTVTTDGSYPFGRTARITVSTAQPVDFSLEVRIPSFVKSARLDGKECRPGTIVTICRRWEQTTQILLEFSYEPEMVARPEGRFVVRRGPLFYALPIGEEWKKYEYTSNGVERRHPYCDYELYPTTKWNYAFADDSFTVGEGKIGKYPFSPTEPPVWLEATFCEINWDEEEGYPGVCKRVPTSTDPIGNPVRLHMIPYGCTNLRITEMPKASLFNA